MNVMVYNKYKELLMSLGIESMKTLDGVYNVDEIIDAFSNFYYDKMILDITSIRDYQNTDNLQKLAMNLNMENVILLLDDNPETNSKSFISKLISLGIYNFTKNADGINYLLVHPHTYKDVVNMHDISELEPPVNNVVNNNVTTTNTQVQNNNSAPLRNGNQRIIGFKDATNHAGATSLVYMLKRHLENKTSVCAIEIDKVDFLYYKDKELISTTKVDINSELLKRSANYNVILIDLNDYENTKICNEVYYLLEPSTLMLNKLVKRDKSALEKLRDEKVILNRCLLSNEDLKVFEYETKLKVFYTLPYVDDRVERIEPIVRLIDKMGL